MKAAAATNGSTSRAYVQSGATVNSSIPVGEVERWRLDAIAKVSALRELPLNWDAQGSNAPGRSVIQTAIEFLLQQAPAGGVGTLRINPVSGGGIHFDCINGAREVEITFEPNAALNILAIDDDIPIEEMTFSSWVEVFDWLAGR